MSIVGRLAHLIRLGFDFFSIVIVLEEIFLQLTQLFAQTVNLNGGLIRLPLCVYCFAVDLAGKIEINFDAEFDAFFTEKEMHLVKIGSSQ